MSNNQSTEIDQAIETIRKWKQQVYELGYQEGYTIGFQHGKQSMKGDESESINQNKG